MKLLLDKVTMAIATQLHSFDLLPTTTFEDIQEKLSDDAVINRYRNDPVFHAKVCSLTTSVLRSVGDDIATLTRQRDLAVEALENCRLLAARHRKEEWARHIMRFCKDAGLSGSPIRNDSIKESENNKAS